MVEFRATKSKNDMKLQTDSPNKPKGSMVDEMARCDGVLITFD